jgi:hypothetical protein
MVKTTLCSPLQREKIKSLLGALEHDFAVALRVDFERLDFNTPKAYTFKVFTFIESSIFSKYREKYLTDEEYRNLQQFMLQQPDAGKIMKGTGGVRKMRWKLQHSGKSGGIRIIYYLQYNPNEFWLLTLYQKSKQESIPAHIAQKLKEVF